MNIRVFRYAAHDRVPDFLALGWHIADDMQGCHHGEHAVMLEWLCGCPMAEPVSSKLTILRELGAEHE